MRMVRIPAGEFFMGSPDPARWYSPEEGPRHKVIITRTFWMSAFEVTNEQYSTVIRGRSAVSSKAGLPVADVSWTEAMEFCEKLSKREGRKYRLPTEAEWEYACRAGSDGEWFFGQEPDDLSLYARFGDATSPGRVGTKRPNPWGLYDIYGNVAEWVLDSYAFHRRGGGSAHQFDLPPYSSTAQTDPVAESKENARAYRGGWYSASPAACRCSSRWGFYDFMSIDSLGFRVAMEAEDAATQP
jgi:formylglycine-generating enzyme required for sulfatase activity